MRAPFLVALVTLPLVFASNFHHKIHSLAAAHAKASKNDRIKTLLAANGTNATSPLSPPANLVSLAAINGTFQIYNSGSLPLNPAPPTACATALTSSIACNETVQLLPVNPYFDVTTLGTICTTGCTSALYAYRSAVVAGCGTYKIPGPNNISYAPTLAVDSVLAAYNVQCEKDPSTGKFCTSIINTSAYNSTGSILTYPTSALCTPCVLGTMNTTLSNPVSYSVSLYQTLQSALAICGTSYKSYNVTGAPTAPSSPGPSTIPIGSNSTSSASCAIVGRNLTIGTTSSCASLSTTYSVSYSDVLTNNPTLSAANCSVVAGGKICLPKACTLHQVATNETCETIVSTLNVTAAQLLSFNPDLGTGCSQISNRVGTNICLSPHGGFPSVTTGGAGNVPSGAPTAKVPPPGPTAAGTTSNCGAWYLVQPNDFCYQIVLNNSITLQDFLTINPEVNANCTNLWAGYDYCVAPFPPLSSTSSSPPLSTDYTSFRSLLTTSLPPPTGLTSYSYASVTALPAPTNLATGTISSGCGYYYNVLTGDTCASIATQFNITTAQFNLYNPEFATSCALKVGSAVCVKALPTSTATSSGVPTPTNVASGTDTKDCAQYYTVVTGDSCGVIETKFSISNSSFYALNPELNAACTNLQLGVAYCIKAISSSTSSGPSISSAPTPTNVAVGTDTKDCAQYYTVVTNDNCGTIETKFGISNATFYLLNPELNAACTNLLLGEAYCVKAVVSNTSSKPSSTSTSTKPSTTSTTSKPTSVTTTSKPTTTSTSTKPVTTTTTTKPLTTSTTSKPPTTTSSTKPLTTSTTSKLTTTSTKPLTTSTTSKPTTTTSTKPTTTTTTSKPTTSTTSKPPTSTTSSTTSKPTTTSHSTTTSALTVPTNIASGTLTTCTTYYTVVSGDNCNAIQTRYNIAISDWDAWNPEVNAACTNIIAGEAYCVAGPNPCPQVYSVVTGDTCFAIYTKYSLTAAQFQTLNPWLDANCDLAVGNGLCVKTH